MTARRIRRAASLVLAAAAVALSVAASASVQAGPGAAEIPPPGEERALSPPLVAPEGSPDAAAVALERRFNELRRELLDDRAATLDWWLAAVAVFLTFLAIVVPLAGAAAAFFGYREFRREAQEHVEALRQARGTAEAHLKTIGGITSEMASKNPDKAKEAVQSVREASNASALDRAAATALTLQSQGEIDKAIDMWRSIANIASETDRNRGAQAWFSSGYLNQKKGAPKHTRAAITDYDEAIRLKPDFPESYNNRGAAKDRLGQYEEAIADYDDAIRLEPDNPEAYNNRGAAKDRLGQHREAIADYDEAIRLKPDNPEAYNNRGNAKAHLGQHREAIADYDEAIRLKPDYPGAYNNRGNARDGLGQHREAIADFDEAIRLEPDNPEAYNNRGVTKANLGQHREAIADCDAAIRLKPDDPKAYHNRAVAKLRLGDADAARQDLLTAIELAEKADDENLAARLRRTLDSLDRTVA